jgi:hypothetical protein
MELVAVEEKGVAVSQLSHFHERSGPNKENRQAFDPESLKLNTGSQLFKKQNNKSNSFKSLPGSFSFLSFLFCKPKIPTKDSGPKPISLSCLMRDIHVSPGPCYQSSRDQKPGLQAAEEGPAAM